MSGWQRITQQWSQVWKRLSPAGRVAFSAFGVVFLVLIAGVGYWSSTTNYIVMCSGLQSEDAAAVIQKLDADRVPYELSGGGGTISVPSAQLLKTKLNLSMAGLPRGAGKGFELFDEMSMGTTPFVQQMTFVRASQAELARTIMSWESIADARVHIVHPDPSPFVRDEKPVTASVTIRTKPGQKLSREAANGLAMFMARSVKGLKPEDVAVIDSVRGVLSDQRDSRTGLASSDQREYQREVETDLATKAQEILARLLGPGQSVVRVTAEMSFRSVNEQSEKVDPEARVATHESVTSSKTTTPNTPRGTTGAAANVANAPAQASNDNGTLKQDETKNHDFAVSRTFRQMVEKQGTIDRLTVAVILIPPGSDPDANPEEALGITTAEAGELVKQAVGFKEGRDKIQVSLGKPALAETEVAEDTVFAAAQRWQNYINLVKASALAIAALAGLVMVVMMFRSPKESNADVAADRSVTPQETPDVGEIVLTLKSWLSEANQTVQPTQTAQQT